MDEPKNDDHVEKIRDIVTIDIDHELSEAELKQIAMQLASLYSDVEQAEERKKNVASQHKNAIDALKVEVKKLSTYINTGFRTEPRVAELFLDYAVQKRMYYDKRTGDLLIEKSFQEEDYQKKINFYAKQEQIEYNNEVGNYAEGQLPPEEGNPFPSETSDDALAKVINEKKETAAQQKAREGAIIRKLQEKPTPKDNLGEHYGRSHEYETDKLPPVKPAPPAAEPDDLFKKAEDNLPPEGN